MEEGHPFSSCNTVKVDALTKLQYGDWLRVAPKKPQEGSSLSRGRIWYHDVGNSSNVPSNDLGKGLAKTDPNPEAVVANLGTQLDAYLGENITDDNMVGDQSETGSFGIESRQFHSVRTILAHATHALLDNKDVGSEESPDHVTGSALDSAAQTHASALSNQTVPDPIRQDRPASILVQVFGAIVTHQNEATLIASSDAAETMASFHTIK
ncbi:hypothetical protein V6N11_052235 [Hibiscus sabdariffa]|uniref:Uncharacterized protein n=1 Tax=Hibiscus sabdariffa TaxID=183260 RepID=A0ABR2U9Z5_9ROSI